MDKRIKCCVLRFFMYFFYHATFILPWVKQLKAAAILKAEAESKVDFGDSKAKLRMLFYFVFAIFYIAVFFVFTMIFGVGFAIGFLVALYSFTIASGMFANLDDIVEGCMELEALKERTIRNENKDIVEGPINVATAAKAASAEIK